MLEALTTYNKKAYEEGIREEGREEGRKEGREEMRRFFTDELLAKDSQLSEKDREIALLKAELEKLTRRK